MIKQRKSRIHGWGVFATGKINKNKRIATYEGEKIRTDEYDKRAAKYEKRGELWGFEINRAWVRDAAVGGNIARFINHACKPNCYIEIVGDTIWVRAGKNIKPGDELTYDYNTGEKEVKCRCRPGCKNTL